MIGTWSRDNKSKSLTTNGELVFFKVRVKFFKNIINKKW